MFKKYLLSCLLLCIIGQYSFCQVSNKKYYASQRTDTAISIDAIGDEAAWKNVEPATDFIQFRPEPDRQPWQRTEVRIIYDNEAIYVLAELFDTAPDSINRELTLRDNFGNSDWFSFSLDTYKDGLNGFGFAVTAAGVQSDFKFSVEGDDDNWDAVWESKTAITDKGWTAEMRIPYSAIRFSDAPEQEWGLQLGRSIRRYRQELFWNRIDPELDGFLLHAGRINNIQNIKSPLRLSLNPFITGYFNQSKDPDLSDPYSTGTAYNLGMDLKYGINDAFTLDMTVVPDFGQTQSDNKVLNISPFEQFFEERRPFFTEGTELFSKGNLFYSRRVGGRTFYGGDVEDELMAGEEIYENPANAQLLNALKISGRTGGGTGIGFFNAIEAEEHATIKNSQGEERAFMTNPLTNYNVFVLDQNLRNNSYVTFINTNVFRKGEAYEANGTGATFLLKTPNQGWGTSGKLAFSQKYYQDSTDVGHTYSLFLDKFSGKLNYGVGYNEESDNYDPNDLGILFSPNERSYFGRVSYNEYAAEGRFNRYTISANANYQRLYDPNVYNSFEYEIELFAVTRNFFAFGLNTGGQPVDEHNYFEPRTGDFSRYSIRPSYQYIGGFISTDYRKTFALDMRTTLGNGFSSKERYRFLSVGPRLRLSDKILITLRSDIEMNRKTPSYANRESVNMPIAQLGEEDILYSWLDRTNWNNVLNARYVFNNSSSVTIRFRHYQDEINYKTFARLEQDGSLEEIAFNGMDEEGNPIFNNNVNIFNIDLQYTKRFAPGSDITFVWKNEISGSDDNYDRNYFQNLWGLSEHYQDNSLSLRIVYFLDYLYLKR